ncbi:hypothetical protein ANCDUO_27284 [Ancylostoma duodenale]|uniref:DDE-1 domain-containing protein n=1 Tax=Ancylostoma duodenale TaxID=51022 RepID=A0A0C2BZC9_9BILA|nr:hypothetical protein ANCDUO_27284 [Ancylostoma duodenale]
MHATEATKSWLSKKRANVMDWPTCSPDQNSMEKLSRIPPRKVYSNLRQFHTIVELKRAIIDAWKDVENDFLENLAKGNLACAESPL